MTLSAENNTEARPWRTDLSPNIFASMQRELYGSTFANTPLSQDDKQRDTQKEVQGKTVFAPGCVFSCASSELTLTIYNWLKSQLLVDDMMLVCCGDILKNISTQKERKTYQAKLCSTLRAQNVRRIVTACPNCYNEFREVLTAADYDIDIVAISELLLKHKNAIPNNDFGQKLRRFSVHDSCPDRTHGVFAHSVRALLNSTLDVKVYSGTDNAKNALVEMAHNKQQSQCCGLGKMLALRAPVTSSDLIAKRLREFGDTEADILITYCATCAQAFQPVPRQLRQGSQSEYVCQHYLELVFNVAIDWQAHERLFCKCLQQLHEQTRELTQEETKGDNQG